MWAASALAAERSAAASAIFCISATSRAVLFARSPIATDRALARLASSCAPAFIDDRASCSMSQMYPAEDHRSTPSAILTASCISAIYPLNAPVASSAAARV